MRIYCLENFKREFEKLKSKNAYHSIEQEIISHFFNKTMVQLCTGTRLNGSSETPYIKKRLKGRGGFRVYFLVLILNDCLYLMHVHAKTGKLGYENVADAFKTSIYKDVLLAIESNDLIEMTLDETATSIDFKNIQISFIPQFSMFTLPV